MIFIPKNGIYKKVLIWLHGLGSSAQEFESFFFDYSIINSAYKIILM